MDGYTYGNPIMLQLGGYQFGIQTAAYQELTRTTEWRWPVQELFGRAPVVQFVGPGGDTITLPGVIFPEWRGGAGQLDAMRAEAARGTTLALVDGQGNSLGRWVIERVEERQSVFAAAGVPRRQEFTVGLRRAPDEPTTGLGVDALAAAPAAAATVGEAPAIGIPASATTPAAQVQGLAGSVAGAARSLGSALNSAYASVQATVTPFVYQAGDAIGGVVGCAQVVADLETTANRVLALVGARPINSTAFAAAQTLSNQAQDLMVRAGSAGALLHRTTESLESLIALGANSAQAAQSVRSAALLADRAAKMCRSTVRDCDTITANA